MVIIYGNFFYLLHNNGKLSVLIRNCLDAAILMKTHNIQFHDEIRKSP